MKKIYYAALIYAVLGLVSGQFYRDWTKAQDFVGHSQLSTMHTHLLALGMIFMLVILALEATLGISKTKWFNLFFWHYNGGLLLAVTMMLIIGLRQVAGESSTPMLSGMAGLGHILITAGIIFLFVAINKRIKTKSN